MTNPENTGFDEDGGRVPTDGFDYASADGEDHGERDMTRAERRELVSRLLSYLGTLSVVQAGRRVVLLHHLLHPVESQRKLAKRLGVSPAAISQSLKRLREEMKELE